MEQTLKQRIIPEVDERQVRRESEKVAEFLDESVKEFLPFSEGDAILDFDDMMDNMEEMQEMTDEMTDSGMFESFEAGGFAGDVAFGEGPAEMGGGGDRDELTQKMDELVNQLSDPRGQDGMADRLNDVGTKIDENKEEAAASTALLAKMGKILKGGAATLLIGGFALSLLQGIYGRVKKFAQHSPLLETVTDMLGMAMSLFLRPIARMIGRALLPMATAMLNLAADFNRVWAEGGAFAAFGFLAGEMVDALFSLPGLIAVSIAGIGALLGGYIGAYAGAKAGAIIGGTIGSIIPGFGTAIGAAIGGTLGLIAGVLIAFNWDKVTEFLGMIWRKITDVENILSFFLGPLAIVAVPFFIWLESIFSKISGWLEGIYNAFQEGGFGGAIAEMLGLNNMNISSIIEGMGFDVSSLKKKVGKVEDAFESASTWVNDKAQDVRDAFDRVETFVKAGAGLVKKELGEAGNRVRTEISTIPSDIKSVISRINISPSNFISAIPWDFPSANQILQQLNVPDISRTFNRAGNIVDDLASEVRDAIDWFRDLTSLDIGFGGGDRDDGDRDDGGLVDIPPVFGGGDKPIPDPGGPAIGLASGGIVTDTVSAVIGEGNESEVVAPLSRIDSMINTRASTNANVSIDGAVSEGVSSDDLERAVERGFEKAQGSSVENELQRVVSEINKLRSDMNLEVTFDDKSKWEVRK